MLLKQAALYPQQEKVLKDLQGLSSYDFSVAKLCGGTALSRCWLDHRVSYDLDFFLPEGFDARAISGAMKSAGIVYQVKDIVDDKRLANQLHGYVIHDGESLKVSFVEDAYYDVYPSQISVFGNGNVSTECIAGLYHRKLRTVSGHGLNGDSFDGGRQKARDLFDLCVLSKEHMPLIEFIDSLPYAFPKDSFINGLISMPWFELVDEFNEIDTNEKWSQFKDVEIAQQELMSQIGAVEVGYNHD